MTVAKYLDRQGWMPPLLSQLWTGLILPIFLLLRSVVQLAQAPQSAFLIRFLYLFILSPLPVTVQRLPLLLAAFA